MNKTQRRMLVLSMSALALAPLVIFAWTGPTATPPGGNVAAPINVGNVDQVKNGGLGLNSLAVFGNSLLGGSTGSNAYLNFGPTTGTAGYGIRDNAGTLEFKNLGGSWASLQSTIFTLCGGGACGGGGGGGSGPWATSGNNIYNSNTGNVGIGTNSPGHKLDVNGALGATGNITVGGATLATNGDLYMPWKGQWLSAALGNKIDFNTWGPGSTYYGTNGDIYLVWRGQWLSTVLSQLQLSQQLGPGYAYFLATNQSPICPGNSVMYGESCIGDVGCWLYCRNINY